MSKIGYIRVSTENQETARQQEIMDSYQVDRIFSEKLSVSTQNAVQFAKDRPQLRAMLDYVREGIEIAKAQGKDTGRKPTPIDWTRFVQHYGEWKSKNITGRDFMRRMGLSANSFYRRVREYEAEHGIAEPTSA
ncbi:MAG: recombinase family protein [Ruminococcus sp.]|uniref:recombinase family protein n=1 Tax=Ruminococcus sp. TaxID=41978 RepID=UPI002600E982|nr:recombinase family protein [Ruminococcus sp.]MCR5540153.1 recombinase family protein [Ruminococcus sp.]